MSLSKTTLRKEIFMFLISVLKVFFSFFKELISPFSEKMPLIFLGAKTAKSALIISLETILFLEE